MQAFTPDSRDSIISSARPETGQGGLLLGSRRYSLDSACSSTVHERAARLCTPLTLRRGPISPRASECSHPGSLLYQCATTQPDSGIWQSQRPIVPIIVKGLLYPCATTCSRTAEYGRASAQLCPSSRKASMQYTKSKLASLGPTCQPRPGVLNRGIDATQPPLSASEHVGPDLALWDDGLPSVLYLEP